MTNLTRFDKDGIELIINRETGESFASIKGYARMSGLSKQAISKRVSKLVNQNDVEMAEMETGYGEKLVNLIPESIISDWIVDDNPELAKAMLLTGVRLYLHHLAGFEYKVVEKAEPPKPELSPVDIRVTDLVKSLQFFDIDVSDPRYKQGLQDLVIDILGLTPNSLPESSEIWLGVAERAEQLGYPLELVTQFHSLIGKFVERSLYEVGQEPMREVRLVNGSQRHLDLYLLTPELDAAIKEFMDA